MKLAEALKIAQAAPHGGAGKLTVFLACGFTPLHLSTFLAAHLRRLAPGRAVEVRVGEYGSLANNLARLGAAGCDAAAVVVEWPDLDPRLGLRGLGGWGPGVLADIRENVGAASARLLGLLEGAGRRAPAAVCLPTLPLPPLSYLPAPQAGAHDLALRRELSEFAARAAALPGVRVVSQQRLDEASPLAGRLDVKSELTAGFPYRVAHASEVAALLARLIQPRPPKKGVITDLDDTLWRGLLGEVGVAGVSWDLDRRSHAHALYQQTLGALAESGVLVAVASKNDDALVAEALRREDMLLPADRVFPREVNWGQKSVSVGRILRAWNVSADSVVFVDDSPIELAEVQASYPEMECLLFPKNDDQAAYHLLERLRDLCGKQEIFEEDSIRVESLRRAGEFREAAAGASAGRPLEEFLRHAGAELTCGPVDAAGEARALELINKTNQFNLNGVRLGPAELRSALGRPGGVSLLASYRDKYGPLGKIAVLLGRVKSSSLIIDTWVMSCRAFGRHIEYKCLEHLFDEYGVSAIELDYRETERNGPVREFLQGLLGSRPGSPCVIPCELFAGRKPALFHTLNKASYV